MLVLFYLLPIGGGDMKFMAFVGFYFGIYKSVDITFMSFAFAALFGIYFMVKQRTIKAKMPFMIGIAPAVFVAFFIP